MVIRRGPASANAALRALGLGSGATTMEIKLAFRGLAHKYHPDKNGHNPRLAEKFKELTAAYKTAIETQKERARQMYLQGESGFGFGSLFRPSADRCFFPSPVNGKKIEAEVFLTFDQAISGVSAELSVVAQDHCPQCRGMGSEKPNSFFVCPKCQGAGHILEGDGGSLGQVLCPKCQGNGRVLKKCGQCGGDGRMERTRVAQVALPAGVEDGSYVVAPGQGHAGAMGGAPGDLRVKVRVGASPIFTRKGMDIYYEAEAPFTMAVFGGHIIVPTIDGDVRVTSPAGLRARTLLRLKGRGALGLGHQYIRMIWRVPTELSPEQESLLRRFADYGEQAACDDDWKSALKRLGRLIRLG